MPTYAYACKACGHHFEINQAFTDDALTTCPECEGHLRKVFNSVGVVFKGSGFYRNDSRSTSTSSSASSESKSADKPAETSKTADAKKSESASSSSSTPAKAGATSGSGSAA